jgi:hypothetical protein
MVYEFYCCRSYSLQRRYSLKRLSFAGLGVRRGLVGMAAEKPGETWYAEQLTRT